MTLFGAFPETRVAVIDLNDERSELELPTPTRCTVHLRKPNIAVNTDTEEMRDPVKLAWRVKTQYGGRHVCHGKSFERAQTRGEGMKYWGRVLDEAITATGGMVPAFDDDGTCIDVPVEEALRELR